MQGIVIAGLHSGLDVATNALRRTVWCWRICNNVIFAVPSFPCVSCEASKPSQNEPNIDLGRVLNRGSFWEGFQERFGYRFWLRNDLPNQPQIGSKSMSKAEFFLSFSFLKWGRSSDWFFILFGSILGPIQRDLDPQMAPKSSKNEELKRHVALNLD